MTDPYFAVRVAGLPLMIMQASSSAEVRAKLRKILKKAEDIESVDRMPQAQVRAVFRDAIKSGEIPESYCPQKHEWGTDASTEYAREITPGEKRNKKKMREFHEFRKEIKEGFDKSSAAHAHAKKLTKGWGRMAKAEYHSDGSASIHTSGDSKSSSAEVVDHLHKISGHEYNIDRSKKGVSKKGGMTFTTTPKKSKHPMGSDTHTIHIKSNQVKEGNAVSADKKPQKYVDPNSGKTKIRMVPMDKKIVDKDKEEGSM
jgi:hypothetical protein